MISGLAGEEADRTGTEDITDLHLVLGAIAESRRWEEQHAWGPHHLRAAAKAAGTTIDDLETRTRAALGG